MKGYNHEHGINPRGVQHISYGYAARNFFWIGFVVGVLATLIVVGGIGAL